MSLHTEIRKKHLLQLPYHMTHIENLNGIFAARSIKSYNQMKGKHRSIANDDVQAGRAGIIIVETNRPLHDYVPLYLGFKTPMVACNQHQNDDLVFIRFLYNFLGEIRGVVVADGNARAAATRFHPYTCIADLDFLDVKAINSVKYANDPETKHRKQAELLVPDQLSIDKVFDIICYSERAKKTIIATQSQHGMSLPVGVNQGWYFSQFEKGDSK